MVFYGALWLNKLASPRGFDKIYNSVVLQNKILYMQKHAPHDAPSFPMYKQLVAINFFLYAFPVGQTSAKEVVAHGAASR